MKRERLHECNRLVIKVGSSLLEDDRREIMGRLVNQIQHQLEQNTEIVLVTSGAIYFGIRALNRHTAPVTLPQKQATAAVGQPQLMSFYRSLFDQYELETAQVLLTQDGIHNHQTYLNASNTMNTLIDMGTVPIVNENDTVATEEIQFGNNDTLASLVTTMIDAELLIILTNVDGLYADGPDSGGEPLREVPRITDEIHDMAQSSRSSDSTVGGMVTKIEAADTLTQAGSSMIIANGRTQNVINRVLDGETIGTFFPSRRDESVVQGRKRWIGYHLPTKGIITVDEGAEQALRNRGTSLLPSGVTEASGQFKRGDAVQVINQRDEEFARGLINYNKDEVNQLQGCQTNEISDILGYHDYDEFIHRDNLVIFPNEQNNNEHF